MNRPAYRPQLDALRAVAVSSVLVTHLLLPFGPAHQGVRLFFVISGFLITGILLKQRDDAGQSLGQKLSTFYLRRTIRIWPIYYLALFAAAIPNLDGIRASLPWHLAYVSNFYYLMIGEWDPAVAGHLWSLSVEEQFYLMWPLVVLLTASKRLWWLLGLGVALAVGYRWIAASNSVAFGDIATPAAFDALCLGGALALANHSGIGHKAVRACLGSAAAISVFALLVLAIWSTDSVSLAFVDLLFAIIFTSVVAEADAGVGGRARKVLEWPPILYIGRISYGIYLYHLFVAYIIFHAAFRFGIDLPRRGALTFLLGTTLTIALASVSWFAVERPLLLWKRRFSYGGARRFVPQEPSQAEVQRTSAP